MNVALFLLVPYLKTNNEDLIKSLLNRKLRHTEKRRKINQMALALKKDLNNSKLVATLTNHGPFYSEIK